MKYILSALIVIFFAASPVYAAKMSVPPNGQVPQVEPLQPLDIRIKPNISSNVTATLSPSVIQTPAGDGQHGAEAGVNNSANSTTAAAISKFGISGWAAAVIVALILALIGVWLYATKE